MNVHRNAKTTPKMRQLIVIPCPARAGRYARIAAALGHQRPNRREVGRPRPPACPYQMGSSRPHRQPRRTSSRVEATIVALRRSRATAWQISAALRLPRSTVTQVFARAGLNRIALLEPPAPVQRYEWPHVGDLLHVDLKRLGRVAGIGHRIHGDRRRRARKVGWEYLHVAIDDATRLTYAEVLAGRRGARLRRVSPAHARVVSSARHPHATAAHRQRDGLSGRHLRRGLSSLDRPAPLHPALSAADQWQSRALHSNAAPRVGVSGTRIAARRGAPPRSAPISVSTTTGVRTRASVDARRGCVPRGCLR